MAKIHIKTLGCRLNQAESEGIARKFKIAGHQLVSDPSCADIRIVNTCTVTQAAALDSRRASKKSNPKQKIVMTGCHSEMHPEEFSRADLVIKNQEKKTLAAKVFKEFGLKESSLSMEYNTEKTIPLYPLQLKNTRAFIKIQDGCNMKCSFCLTTIARGKTQSRPATNIITEISTLVEQGCKEIVLTGVQAGAYGIEFNKNLAWLIEKILHETSIPRIRLSSIEPYYFNTAWLKLWEKYEGRICRHLHLSLQSGSNKTLKKMQRAYTSENFAETIKQIRASIPGIAISTDIIVGFPGESGEEHRKSLDFVESMQFAKAHIFSYSLRPGTRSAEMPDHITVKLKKEHYTEMKKITDASTHAFAQAASGKTQIVLWENFHKNGFITGLSDTYLKVYGNTKQFYPNTLSTVKLTHNKKHLVASPPKLETNNP